MDQEHDYHQWQDRAQQEWESLCGRCGALEDPCEYLRKDVYQKFYCVIYKHRFGMHKTISGKPLRCVSIRKILHHRWPGDDCCGYKKHLNIKT